MGPEIEEKPRSIPIIILSIALGFMLILVCFLAIKLDQVTKNNQNDSSISQAGITETHTENDAVNTIDESEAENNEIMLANRIASQRIINKSSVGLKGYTISEEFLDDEANASNTDSRATQRMKDVLSEYFPDAEPNAFAYNGCMLTNPDYICDYPLLLSVKGQDYEHYYIRLHYLYPYGDDQRTKINEGKENDIAFFVGKDNEIKINVPDGCYEFWICCGENWNGTESYFGEESVWYTAKKPLVFYSDDKYDYGYEVILSESTIEEMDLQHIKIPSWE